MIQGLLGRREPEPEEQGPPKLTVDQVLAMVAFGACSGGGHAAGAVCGLLATEFPAEVGQPGEFSQQGELSRVSSSVALCDP